MTLHIVRTENYYFCVCHCYKTPNLNSLERNGLFGLQFQVKANHFEDIKLGTPVTGHIPSTVKNKERVSIFSRVSLFVLSYISSLLSSPGYLT